MTTPTLKPGDLVMHRSGAVREIERRKETRDGYWLVYGGGLSDAALAGPDWVVVDTAELVALFERMAAAALEDE